MAIASCLGVASVSTTSILIAALKWLTPCPDRSCTGVAGVLFCRAHHRRAFHAPPFLRGRAPSNGMGNCSTLRQTHGIQDGPVPFVALWARCKRHPMALELSNSRFYSALSYRDSFHPISSRRAAHKITSRLLLAIETCTQDVVEPQRRRGPGSDVRPTTPRAS